MTLSRIDINNLLSGSTQQSAVLDPLRLLSAGTKLTVEVAIDPKTGAPGIKFNGSFYPTDLPGNAKLGQLLRVILQANNDQIILKLFDQIQDSSTKAKLLNPQNTKPDLVLTKQEKFLLREVLYPPSQSVQNAPRVLVEEALGKKAQTKIEQLKESQIANQTLSNNLAGKIKLILVEDRVTTTKFEQKFLVVDKLLSNHNQPVLLQPNIKTETRVDQTRNINFSSHQNKLDQNVTGKPIDLLVKNLSTNQINILATTLPSKQTLEGVVKSAISQLLPQIIFLLKSSYENEDEMFVAIKKLIASKQGIALDLLKPKERLQDNNTNHVQLNKSIETEDLATQFTKSKWTNLKESIQVKPGQIEGIVSQQQLLQPLQSALNNLVATTNILQKIYTDNPIKKEGVLLLLPLFIGGALRHAESYFEFEDNSKQNKPKKRTPKLSKIKLTLPELGEVVIDVFTHGSDVQLVVFVHSETAKQQLQDLSNEINQLFLSEGLSIRDLKINISHKQSLIPSWIADEIGVTLRA